MHDSTLLQLRLEWKNGDAVRVGREILAALAPAAQVERAASILDLCRQKWTPVPAVDAVASLARNPSRWREGHDHFSAVRALTLVEEKRRTNDVYYSLLFVAENTAKTIYNATPTMAPFDEDSPWWLAANALDMASKVKDARFEEQLWRALTGQS